MKNQEAMDNRRILAVDVVSIHEHFRKVLAPQNHVNSLHRVRAALFGEAPRLPTHVRYELQFVNQGRDGLGLVKGATYRGCPYAVAFVDMRMRLGGTGSRPHAHLVRRS